MWLLGCLKFEGNIIVMNCKRRNALRVCEYCYRDVATQQTNTFNFQFAGIAPPTMQ